MSTDAKPADAKPSDAKAPDAASPPGQPSAVMGILKLVVPALFAAGAAYGGTRASAHAAPAHGGEAPAHAAEMKPPGPTLALDPFLVTLLDANHKAHPMKMTVAIEFSGEGGGGGEHGGGGKDDPKNFVPRIRDAFLALLRTLTLEQATDPVHVEKLRTELVERAHKVGAVTAERILVTDFVVQ